MTDFFKDNNFNEYDKDGIDEEVVMLLSLINGDQRREAAYEIINKHKPWVKDIEKIYEEFKVILKEFEDIFGKTELSKEWDVMTELDLVKRKDMIDSYKQELSEIIDYFKPSKETTPMKRVNLLPTNFVLKIKSGASFNFGKEYLIQSSMDNIDNLKNEFLHGVINPIVDRLETTLSEELKKSIKDNANVKLKDDYGEHWYSLLCEELIRTYNDYLFQDRKPMTIELFKERLENMSEEDFKKEINYNLSVKNRLNNLSIFTLDDLKNKAEIYFNTYEINKLKERIYSLYEKYNKTVSKNEDINFEQFILNEIPNIKF